MKRIITLGLLIVLLAGIARAQPAAFQRARVFASNMILQREQTCPVFA